MKDFLDLLDAVIKWLGGGTPAVPDAEGLSLSIPIAGTGYTAPAAPPGVDDSRSLDDLHPELRRRYEALAADFTAETGHQLIPTQTYRSPKRQAELYAKGRTEPGQIVTMLDGIHKKSRHNVYPAEAIDVAVDVDPGPGKHVVWDATDYEPLGPLADKHGLIWGGRWVRPHDLPHLELPKEAA